MTRLLRALRRSAEQHGLTVTFESLSEKPWESATFSGAVHRIAVRTDPSPKFEAWLTALTETDLPMPGHIVADIVVTDHAEATCTLEVHTIAE